MDESEAFHRNHREIFRKSPGIEIDAAITVLSISPSERDHVSLKGILKGSQCLAPKSPGWNIEAKLTLEAAIPALRRSRIPIVLCECDLLPGAWRAVLAELASVSDPPALILTSRVADECMWSAALNLGVYDVLATPFDPKEVVRVLSSAWLNWEAGHGIRNGRDSISVSAGAQLQGA
ncbi:MAG: hypothetical protein LAQ30_08070 [Acidobacteriia bacterium]|nr:hypothetical protein [Terriglobia bacterium]